jgi:uncharacterized lipoprotein YehR (DUF1307 family)
MKIMKKLYSLITIIGLSILITGCGSNSVSKPSFDNLDERVLCNIESNGIDNVLATAIKYNKIAKEEGLEFKRLGMTTTQYIDGSISAIKESAKQVVLLNKKGKATKNSVSVEYAVQRACKFAVGALTLKEEGKKTWRAAVPGDGFKY